MDPIYLNPECHYGKHDACNGDAWNADKDMPTDCDCECHWGKVN